MNIRTQKLLEDVLDAARFIVDSCRNKELAHYQSDRMLRQAVERNFEIIGEALNRLKADDPDVFDEIEHGFVIIGFRNVLAHGYDVIDDARVWKTITSDVPDLVQQVYLLLGSA